MFFNDDIFVKNKLFFYANFRQKKIKKNKKTLALLVLCIFGGYKMEENKSE